MAFLKAWALLLFVALTINALPIEEGVNDVSKAAAVCYNFQCENFCRQTGHSGGMCYDLNTCHCFLSYPKQVEEKVAKIVEHPGEVKKVPKIPVAPEVPQVPRADKKLDEVAVDKPVARANCSDWSCNNECKMWGYKGGFCSNIWTCQCY